MREIKFRVWCKENEQFIQFNKIGFLEDGSLWYVQGVDETNPPYFENQNDWELMQYTGLKDKKSVEIYEGDIVRFTNSIDEIYNEVGKVTWEQSECNFVAQYKTANCVTQEENGTTITIYLISNETYRECVEYEVIGNIYENPELLEREPQ